MPDCIGQVMKMMTFFIYVCDPSLEPIGVIFSFYPTLFATDTVC